MIRTSHALAVAILAAALLVAPHASAASPPPEGFEFTPDSATVMMGIGCTGTGVCEDTQYWIGDNAGDSSVGSFPGPTTPANEVIYQVEGEVAGVDFPADAKLSGREHYLRTDAPLTGQVTLAGYGGAGSGVNTTVDVRIEGRNTTTGQFLSLEATATEHHLPGGDLVLEYSIDLDPAMDGDVVVIHNLNLVVRGVNVLSGFIDGEGGSFFELPTYNLVPVVSEETPTEEPTPSP